MIKIVVQAEVAEEIRRSSGAVELVDEQGIRVGVVQRSPTEAEIQFAKSRVGSGTSKVKMEDLISKLETI